MSAAAAEVSLCDLARELLVEQTETALRTADELALVVARAGASRSSRAARLAAEYLEARKLTRQARAWLQLEGCW